MLTLSNTNRTSCEACAELAAAWLAGVIQGDMLIEMWDHFQTCEITTAACDAGRAQLAAREAVAVEIDELEVVT